MRTREQLDKHAAYMREWRARNRERHLEAQRASQATYYVRRRDTVRTNRQKYRQSPKGKAAQKRAYENTLARVLDWRYRRVYGITLVEYEALVAAQNGLCAICQQPETHVGRGGKVARLAVDHHHASGKRRGLLCRRCNQAIGLFGEDPIILERAAAYIRG